MIQLSDAHHEVRDLTTGCGLLSKAGIDKAIAYETPYEVEKVASSVIVTVRCHLAFALNAPRVRRDQVESLGGEEASL